jgi:soluble lytic murein transglycosylase
VAQASLGQAKTYLAEGAYQEVVDLLDPFLALPASERATDDLVGAHILLADGLRASGAPLAAAEHYSAALALEPVLTPYAHLWLGDAFYDAGAYAAAANAYETAELDIETASTRVWLLEKAADAWARHGDYAAAMAAYDAILAIARIPEYRAEVIAKAGETALAFGETAEAYERLETLISTYPEEEPAYDALVRLVEAGRPVDDFLRGMIDYRAEAYGPAVEAFYRVILGEEDHSGEPHYYAARSFLEAGSVQLAVDEFDLLIETHPRDAYVPDAWMGKAETLVALGRRDGALEAYQTGLDRYPESDALPEAAWDAVESFEDAGLLTSAADMMVELAVRYPNDLQAPEARFRGGLLYYRAGDLEAAQTAWQDLSLWYPYAASTQAAYYWLGKTYLTAGETVSATLALTSAMSLGRWDYYGLQASDQLTDRETFGAYPDLLASCDDPEAQAEAEAWLADWLNLAPDAPLGALPESLSSDPRFQRGTLMLRLGHFDEGRTELEALRVAKVDDALAQYQLALAFRDLGLYRSSILAAAALWRLSPAEEVETVPRFIGCLTYPRYYRDLVEAQATEHDLSPLFIYALLRQESLFEGYATSIAAAHGLMQVIPTTGAAIAEALDWPPDYETNDLYRPMVSVRFGVWYLAEQRDLLEGDLFAALAAYNGGPGNALRWMEAADGDTDLFVELIDFEETRKYVRFIREHYAHYRHLYARPVPAMAPATVLRDPE